MKAYHTDHDHEILWITNPKCASTSITEAIHKSLCYSHDVWDGRSFPLTNYKHYYTITFIRHPWARIESAIKTVFRDGSLTFAQRIEKHILCTTPPALDRHVRPYYFAFQGFDVNFWGRVETMDTDWAWLMEKFPHLVPIPHNNLGKPDHYPELTDESFDWDSLLPIYQKDIDLYEACDSHNHQE